MDANTLPRNPHMASSGDYHAFVWPGGYPLFYVTKDGGLLCPKCANDNAELTCDATDSQWYIVAQDVNWEDPHLYCDHCSKPIESAYGEETVGNPDPNDPDGGLRFPFSKV